MPRGKRTVYTVSCTSCKRRVATKRFHKQNSKSVTYKDMESKLKPYCPGCKKRQPIKLKEERHSK